MFANFKYINNIVVMKLCDCLGFRLEAKPFGPACVGTGPNHLDRHKSF